MKWSTRLPVILAAASAVLLVVGCGDSDGGDSLGPGHTGREQAVHMQACGDFTPIDVSTAKDDSTVECDHVIVSGGTVNEMGYLAAVLDDDKDHYWCYVHGDGYLVATADPVEFAALPGGYEGFASRYRGDVSDSCTK